MDILFDTANLDDIERLTPIYPVTGVTTNPTILKAEGKVDFYAHFRRIREIIGPDRTLHVQVLAKDAKGMIDDAHKLLDKIDDKVYPKIPTTEAGIAAMLVSALWFFCRTRQGNDPYLVVKWIDYLAIIAAIAALLTVFALLPEAWRLFLLSRL